MMPPHKEMEVEENEAQQPKGEPCLHGPPDA